MALELLSPLYTFKYSTKYIKFRLIQVVLLRSQKINKPFSYSKKNQNRAVFCYILSKFRMCTILIQGLTPLDRTSCIKMYKNNSRSSLFCRIAKRSIEEFSIIRAIRYFSVAFPIGCCMDNCCISVRNP